MKLILGIITGLQCLETERTDGNAKSEPVSNIGFRRDSTHTAYSNSPLANMPTFELDQIVHPSEIIRNEEADRNAFNFVFNNRCLPW